MSRENETTQVDDMRPEYNLRGGTRGRFYQQYVEGTNVVVLDPDVAAVFHDSESVNDALRVIIKAAGKVEPPARPAL
jgi:hypothetical protein